MAQRQRLRENSRLQPPQSAGWSTWILAMVPFTNNRIIFEARSHGQEGYVKSDIGDALGGVGNNCGIYEWRATRNDQPKRVVYVGSTCPRGGLCPRLKNRIIGYCTNGNHKKDLINDALRKGYELWVRYKLAENVVEARGLENDLLAMYDYAWNVRSNGVIRGILPPPPMYSVMAGAQWTF